MGEPKNNLSAMRTRKGPLMTRKENPRPLRTRKGNLGASDNLEH